ncbi:MAG: hypothetical protein KC635_24855, partial [Myxococcales bacterium]|nr:hypothetical protein [Myxococcales bacterium]
MSVSRSLRLAALLAVTALGIACDGDGGGTTDGAVGDDAADAVVLDTTEPDAAEDTAVADTAVADTADSAVPDTAVPDTAVLDTAALDTAPEDTTPPLPACEPPLALAPAEAFVTPYGLVTFTASGGTGAYRYELVAAPSGGSVSAVFGTYLSGPGVGSVDVVRVTDTGCEGEARATVEVVTPLALLPPAVDVAPGGSVAFSAEGGTGEYRFELLVNATGATLDEGGAYVAGPTPGVDRVRVVDVGSHDEADGVVHVVSGAALGLVPARLFLLDGESWAVHAVGGSGSVTLTVDGA